MPKLFKSENHQKPVQDEKILFEAYDNYFLENINVGDLSHFSRVQQTTLLKEAEVRMRSLTLDPEIYFQLRDKIEKARNIANNRMKIPLNKEMNYQMMFTIKPPPRKVLIEALVQNKTIGF